MRGLLVGDRVRLCALKDEDYSVMEEWFNDTYFLRHYDMLPAIPLNMGDLKKSMENFLGNSNSYVFAVRRAENNLLIGIVGLFDIQWANGVGTFFIGIGDNESTGKGCGSEALKLILDFGFNELNLHRIQLNVIQYNEKAIRLYEKTGFKKEGVFRELLFRDNKRYDLYLYGLLREEWYDKNPLPEID